SGRSGRAGDGGDAAGRGGAGPGARGAAHRLRPSGRRRAGSAGSSRQPGSDPVPGIGRTRHGLSGEGGDAAAAPGRGVAAGVARVRALSALAVLYSRAAFWTGRYAEDTAGYISSRLEVAVPVFCALSACLLFRPWAAMLRGDRDTPVGRAPALGRYLYRRARRILPAYWLTVVVVYLVYLVREAGPFGRGWEGFVRNMTLTQLYGYGHQHDSLTQNWSLAIEVAFYLALPV